jgi:hypothetical protein
MKRLLLSLSIIVLASTEVNAQCASYTQSYGYQSYQQSYSYNQKGLFKGGCLAKIFKKKAYMQEACGYVSVNFIPIYSTPMYPTPTPTPTPQNNYPPPPNKTTPTPQTPPPTPQPGVQR